MPPQKASGGAIAREGNLPAPDGEGPRVIANPNTITATPEISPNATADLLIGLLPQQYWVLHSLTYASVGDGLVV